MPQKKKSSTSNRKSNTSARKKNAGKKPETTARNQGVSATIWAIFLIGFAVCLIICFCAPDAGVLCKFVYNAIFGLFGWVGILIPFFLLFFGIILILRYRNLAPKVMLSTVFVILLSAFVNVCDDPEMKLVTGNANLGITIEKLFKSGIEFKSGGVIGGAVSEPLMGLMGAVITGIVVFLVMIIAFVSITGLTFYSFIGTPEERRAAREEKEKLYAEQEEERRQKRIAKRVSFTLPDMGDDEEEEKPRKKKKIPVEKVEKKEELNFDIEDTKINVAPFPTNLDNTEKPAAPFDLPTPPVIEEEKITSSDIAQAKAEVAAQAAEGLQNEKPYEFPSVELLTMPKRTREEGVAEELRKTGEKLTETLSSFNVETHILQASRGPTVTRYELAPEQGVKISKITSLSDDIALSLAAKGVRIEAPIPGKAAIGIEIPNQVQQTVNIRDIIDSDEFRNAPSKVTAALGKDISGEKVVINLAKMPHLLIAGATGTGKSVCINSIIISLLYKATPDEVKLILVDPKMVEFTVYKGIPHLLIPVVTDPKKAAGALSWAVTEMLSRYQMFAEKGVRDFAGYNKSLEEGEKKLPQIVIIIDELADLMMASPKEVEDAIARLAQMARAAGMHLVIATQRPSADVITGIIKANVPSRIALAVSSGINSRIILDDQGAEKLIGRGDMLYDPLGATKPLRVQGCFVSDKEVEAVVEAVKENYIGEYDNEALKKIEQITLSQQQKGKGGGGLSGSGQTAESEAADDEMFDRAVEVVVESGQASTSMLQRRIGLGYARAARLIDCMEQRGIVGPYQGSKPREVLISKEQWLEMKMRAENPDTAASDGGVPDEI